MSDDHNRKPLGWVGDSREVLRSFPKPVRIDLGYSLDRVQRGLEPFNWKPRNDIGPGVIQLMEQDAEGWYRVFFVAKFEDAVWVLHAFKKKTNETSRADIENGKNAYRALRDRTGKGKKEPR